MTKTTPKHLNVSGKCPPSRLEELEKANRKLTARVEGLSRNNKVLKAKIDRQAPVIEAAVSWDEIDRNSLELDRVINAGDALHQAVATYRKDKALTESATS